MIFKQDGIFKKNKFSILRIGISFVFIGLLVFLMKDKLPAVIGALKKTNLSLFLLACIIYACSIILISFRLKFILSVQKLFIPLKKIVSFTFIGFFFNNFLPTTVGGDIVKAYYVSRNSNNKLIAFSNVLIDRIFGLIAFIVIALVILIFIEKKPQYITLLYLLGTIFFVSFLGIFFLSNFKLMNWFSNIFKRFKGGRVKEGIIQIHNYFIRCFKNKKVLFSVISISWIIQLVGVVMVYFLIKSLRLDISIFVVVLVLPIIYAVSMIPSINGLGVREAAFVFCLKDIIGSESALALSLLFLAVILFNSIIGGIIFAGMKENTPVNRLLDFN